MDAFEDVLYNLHGIGSGGHSATAEGGKMDQFLLFRAVLETESLDAIAVSHDVQRKG